MKKLVLLALCCAAFLPAADVQSPQVRPDRTTVFRFVAPYAKAVTVEGDWRKPGETIAMTKDADGVWTATAGPFEPGAYIYGYSVDGEATPDPRNPFPKLRAAGVGSLLEIPGASPWETRDVPHGEVRILFEKSKALHGETRWMFVYTPPGYDQNAKRKYPLLYLLHGSNDTAAGWVTVGSANYILDNLIADGKAKEMVVVMPFGHAVPYGTPPGQGPSNTDVFERYLLEDVMPLIESRFRVLPGSANRAIVGLSMGGGQSLTIGFRNLDKFDAIGAFSAAAPSDFEQQFAAELADPKGLNKKLKLLWFACGRDDRLMERSEKLHELLEAKGVRHTFKPTPGVHNYAAWREYLNEVAPLLFR
ncbi:MAG: esterase family protein [Bryobacterales bacterium]|nr:esterase family protein [Acidobacteriota bacterium]MCB9384603.1 esterase family protein [Bryobacterales bacterium]